MRVNCTVFYVCATANSNASLSYTIKIVHIRTMEWRGDCSQIDCLTFML